MNERQRLQRIADNAQLEAQSARRGIRNTFLFGIAFWTAVAAIFWTAVAAIFWTAVAAIFVAVCR